MDDIETIRLADKYIGTGSSVETPLLAIKLLDSILEKSPENASAMSVKARAKLALFYQTGKKSYLHNAKETALEAVSNNPQLAHGYYILWSIETSFKSITNARNYALQAVELNPEISSYHVAVGTTYGYQKSCLTHYNKALELNPNNIYCLMRVAYCYYHYKKYRKCYDVVEQALKIDAENGDALALMALLQFKKKNYVLAVEHAIFVLSRYPSHNQALRVMALVESRKNIILWPACFILLSFGWQGRFVNIFLRFLLVLSICALSLFIFPPLALVLAGYLLLGRWFMKRKIQKLCHRNIKLKSF